MATAKLNPIELNETELKIRSVWDGVTIEGVYLKNLKTMVDGRGDLTEIWSKKWQDPNLVDIEHAYYNLTDKGVVKGWHWHEDTFSQYIGLAGRMQIVLIDLNKDSKTFGEVNQFVFSSKNPQYIKIPPFVLKGWKSLEDNGIIINLLSSAKTEDNFKVPSNTFLPNIWQPINE